MARLTVSPVRSASSSSTGREARARSTSATTEPASRTSPYPSRYFSVLGFCSTRPCSSRVDNSRKTVDLCTSSRRARSVTRISGSVPRSLRISRARSSDCTLLRVAKPVLIAQPNIRRSKPPGKAPHQPFGTGKLLELKLRDYGGRNGCHVEWLAVAGRPHRGPGGLSPGVCHFRPRGAPLGDRHARQGAPEWRARASAAHAGERRHRRGPGGPPRQRRRCGGHPAPPFAGLVRPLRLHRGGAIRLRHRRPVELAPAL